MSPPDPAWRLEIHDAIGSTSDRCAERAAAGEPGGFAVLARRQTSGRGSRGRPWQSPLGNLSLSVLLRPEGGGAPLGRWPLLAGVALAEATRAYLPDAAALSLKWPNDVLLRGGKFAGILIDASLRPDGGAAWLILGIGANLAVAPDLPDRPAAALASEGVAPPAPEAFARAVLDRLAWWQAAMARDGFAAVRGAWLAQAHPVGTPVAVSFGGARCAGEFGGLSEEGHLLLRTAEGVRSIATGEVLLSPGG